MNKVNVYTLMLLSLLLLVIGCGTTNDCVEQQILGNMGNIVNSNLDEHSPSILIIPPDVKQKHPDSDTNDYLYFTTTLYAQGNEEQIYNLLLHDLEAGAEHITDETFPLNNTTLFRNAGMPVYRYDATTDKLKLYFAALPKTGRLSRDIYYSDKDIATNEWSAPTQVSINTQYWDSHPTISPDGQILLFASDRPGGIGDIDIWVAFLDESGNWSEPINLGEEINTAATDYTPMFTQHNDIVFSTNGRGERQRNDFDVFSAIYDSVEQKWKSPKRYGFPINTEFNETGAAIYNNRIFLSSDRRGGCGGKDIYSFQICGPVTISGNIKCPATEQVLEGEILLFDELGNTIAQSLVGTDGSFNLDVIEPNKNFIVDYRNKCYPLKKNIYNFRTPCSDSSIVKMVVSMIMPEKTAELELTEIEIPFFVTGYYKPNTEMNLNALKLGFSYNLYGNNTKSKYIENPGDSYNQYVSQVEASLDDVVKYMAQMVAVLDNKCSTETKKGKLMINVQGWADPRNINPDSEYLDEDISDKTFNVNVKKGQKMNNELLSKLRAYYTAKYFESKLIEEFGTVDINSMVQWNIEGKGVDTTENIEDGLKRKVKILLEFVE